ncbi:MAG: TetR/AcrR family transcriptional regulator [Bacteroidetes bacterium]|nr:TetR/AcrR family transcriptional regulator [Bacteroidota bacterium]
MEEKEIFIIEKVGELFKKYGIKSVSMDDIAQQLCISKKTLYQYFKDKADLVTKVVNINNCEKDQKFLEIINMDLNAIDSLLEVSKHLIEMLKGMNPPIIYDLRKYYPELTKELIINRRQHVYNNIKNNIIKGINEGVYRKDLNPEIITTFYVKRIDDIFFEDEETLNKYPQHELFTQMFIYHVRGIVNSQGLAYFENKIKNEPII